jgi:hypothetical protein
MSVNEQMRMNYHVARWDREKQRGYIIDRTGYEFLVTRANLAPECEGQLAEGDLVSGVAIETTVGDILIEKGSNPIRERKEFASEGVEPLGSWAPRSGTPQKFGNPDSGKFSHPKS